ncbi:hypothetical protein BXZ70DRAFT_886088, partial [Cristinia sonorae]
VLRKDFFSLLSLIYNSATKVSLTLRPPTEGTVPAYAASLPVLKEFVTHVSSLTTCATLFDEHGKTIAEDVRMFAKDVCEASRSLALVLSTFLSAPKTKEEQEEDKEYLVRTGAVHETIERIRKELPEDNLAAVRERWRVDKGMLEDTLEDVNGIVEDAEDGGDEEDEDEDEGFGSDEDEDGLAELGFTSKKLSKVEAERVKKIQPLIRICVLMHKRVLLDLLKPTNASSPTTLDSLPPLSHELLIATEEVVAVLYAPQNPTAMSSALAVLDNTVRKVQTTLSDKALLPAPLSLEDKLANTSISGEGGKNEKDLRKWFETCFEQIHRLYNSVKEGLDSERNAT